MNPRLHAFLWHPLVRSTIQFFFWGVLLIGLLFLCSHTLNLLGLSGCDPISPVEVCT